MTDRSQALFAEAQKYIVGGVNSPVRAFKAVGGRPLFIKGAEGSRIFDVDGREYVDYVCSWGPLILGHSHPSIVQALKETIEHGTSYGAPTELEIDLASMIVRAVPSIELVRLVNSGTEAVMSAIRLARAYTGRSKIIKFEGCYHGHADSLLVKAGSGATTLGIPDSPGVPHDLAKLTLTVAFNDLAAVQEITAREGAQIACIIVEPVAGNMGLVLPEPGFLAGLRSAADRCGALLIFDEVISGFRLAPTTYGALCGIRPDLTTLGKIIGGGMPIGAVGGRADVMDALAPSGKVYQAGTLSGNPVAVAAGRTTLEILQRDNPYPELDARGRCLEAGIRSIIDKRGVALGINRLGGMFTLFFRQGPVRNLADAKTCDTRAHAAFFHAMLKQGIYLPPSQFETAFISTAHSKQHVEAFIAAAADCLGGAPHGGT